MKTYRTKLWEANHMVKLKAGNEWCFVVPTKEQNPEGGPCVRVPWRWGRQYPVGLNMYTGRMTRRLYGTDLSLPLTTIFVVTENHVCRLSDITDNDAQIMGLYYPGMTRYFGCDVFQLLLKWDARYAMPRPQRRKGEIVRYRCWPWNKQFWINNLGTEGRHVTGRHQWKGLPLDIHENPYVEVVKGVLS